MDAFRSNSGRCSLQFPSSRVVGFAAQAQGSGHGTTGGAEQQAGCTSPQAGHRPRSASLLSRSLSLQLSHGSSSGSTALTTSMNSAAGSGMQKSRTALALDRMGMVAPENSSLSPCYDMDLDGDNSASSRHSSGAASPLSCAVATPAIDIPSR